MGFFLRQFSDASRFLSVKSYNALKWCNLFRLLYGNRHAARCWADPNSLINSILLIDDDLAIHYANPAAQQLLAQSSRKLFGTPLPELLSYFSLNIELMQESLEAGQGFTDNEVTLVIDGRSHILSVTAQRMPDGIMLLEMAPMDNQRRLSQEQLQHAQQVAARDLVRGLAHEIKNPLGGLRGAAQLLQQSVT